MRLSAFGLILTGFYFFELSHQVPAFGVTGSFIGFHFYLLYYLFIIYCFGLSHLFEIMCQDYLTKPALLTNINI